MSSSFFRSNSLYFLGASLLFLVLSSKNILIYNEELLIALSFLAFIATSVSTAGASLEDTFHSRKMLIQEELQAFFTSKETLLQEVKKQAMMQSALAHSMQALGTLVQKELQHLHAQRDMTVKNTVQAHMLSQLHAMMDKTQSAYTRVHTVSSVSYASMMMHAYAMDKENMHAQFMENALQLLQAMQPKRTSSKRPTALAPAATMQHQERARQKRIALALAALPSTPKKEAGTKQAAKAKVGKKEAAKAPKKESSQAKTVKKEAPQAKASKEKAPKEKA